MELLVAIGHILGSIVAVTVLGVVIMLIAGWESKRNEKHSLEEIAVELGVAVEDLDKPEMTQSILQFVSKRYSNELFRNRLSDLCGALRTMWSWVGLATQVAVLGAAIWYTVAESFDSAVHAWWLVPVALFFWLVGVAFALACRLFTERYPGQAKQARKTVADALKTQRPT